MEELTALQQGYHHLRLNEFGQAKEVFEEILAHAPGTAQAYIGALLARENLREESMLAQWDRPLQAEELFSLALQHADPGYAETLRALQERQKEYFAAKEERYREFCRMAETCPEEEEALARCVSLGAQLKEYADCRQRRRELEERLEALRQKKAKKRKRLWWILPGAIVLLAVLAVLSMPFTAPKRDGVQYLLTMGGYTVTGIDGAPETVRIADSIHGIAVTEIGEKAFKDQENLREVRLGPKVSRIGASAFSGCENLEKLEGAHGVSEVNKKAFKDCKALEELRFSPDVVLAKNAFRDCPEDLRVYAGEERRPVDVDE